MDAFPLRGICPSEARTSNTVKINNYDMDEKLQNAINECSEEYKLISKTKDDILDDLDFENEEERVICDSIISSLERTASETIREMKVAQLPYIGCLRINPVQRKFNNAKLHLSAVRKSITKEQYKEHVRSYFIDLQEQQKKEDARKLILTRIRRNNKKKYELYYRMFGRVYAELFIMSIYWLKDVPHDSEWEEHYQELVNKEQANNTKPNNVNTFRIDKYLKDTNDIVHRVRFRK